jgi:F0F1-type ATP synthase assembly protein I
MTAQAGERLFYKGEETWMAAEPLNQYLRNRSNIKFVSPSTDCWRGYYGHWEIADKKLNLIGLKAYIEGCREVDLNYLFPGQNKVFANWFSGEIRLPQGKILEYVHMGYASLYVKDLFLVIENGILLKQYEVDNTEKYQELLKQRKQEERERPAREAKEKKVDRIIAFIAISFLVFVFIGICIGMFYLIRWGTILAYLILTTIVSGLTFLIFIVIKNRIKNKKHKNLFK